MSRLFITSRELNFISDINKELIKDVVGQRIFYYPISENKTQIHGVYNEALQKVFDNPIAIECLVDNTFQTDTSINEFGVDAQYRIEAFVQYRDLVDKGITLSIGDFFSFSDVFYEITARTIIGNIYGMPEHREGIKIIGTKARESQFKAVTVGPTDIARTDADAVQTTFVQQRGAAANKLGPTNDKRDLQKTGVLTPPLGGPREVSPLGDDGTASSSFYGDEK